MVACVLKSDLAALEAHIGNQFGSYDRAITEILKTIRELMSPSTGKSRPIGFTADLEE
jgi:hypothetical protein